MKLKSPFDVGYFNNSGQPGSFGGGGANYGWGIGSGAPQIGGSNFGEGSFGNMLNNYGLNIGGAPAMGGMAQSPNMGTPVNKPDLGMAQNPWLGTPGFGAGGQAGMGAMPSMGSPFQGLGAMPIAPGYFGPQGIPSQQPFRLNTAGKANKPGILGGGFNLSKVPKRWR